MSHGVKKTFAFKSNSGHEAHVQIVVEDESNDDHPIVKGPHGDVQTVIIACHGMETSASAMFAAVPASMRNAPNIHVVAPDLNGKNGKTSAENALAWGSSDWGEGAASHKPEGYDVSSFEVLDKLIAFFAHQPSVKRVILVGHSLGGQLVQRYSVLGSASGVHHTATLTYVAMNPSTYVYLSEKRPYKYGLQGRTAVLPSTYDDAARRAPAAWLYKRLSQRKVYYLHGQRDLGLGDSRPQAMRQGANRLQRFNAFRNHLAAWAEETDKPAPQTFFTVANSGHDAAKMMASDHFAKIVHDKA